MKKMMTTFKKTFQRLHYHLWNPLNREVTIITSALWHLKLENVTAKAIRSPKLHAATCQDAISHALNQIASLQPQYPLVNLRQQRTSLPINLFLTSLIKDKPKYQETSLVTWDHC